MTVAEQLAFAASKIPGNTVAWKVLFCIAAFWTLLEIGFFLVVHFVMLPRVQKLTKAHPYHGDMMKMMRRSVDLVKQLHCYTFDKYLSGFCRGADFKDIHLENFRSFLTWAMYNKHLPEATPEELEKVAEVLAYAQQEHPVLKTMPPGFNPKVKHTRMTIDPIPIIHRPLLMYVLIRAKELIANTFYMPACGFQCLEVDGQTYWYKKQCGASDNTKSDDKNTVTGSTGKEPVLLLHGISTGWGNYVSMACALGAGRDIILVDMDAVKLNSLQFHMPTPQKFAESIVHILNRHNIDRVSLVGHSFGSMTAGWFLRHHPERVSHLTLLDPVSLLLSFPEVAYSFLYRKPSTLMEWVIHVFAAREITISHTLRRNFWWYNNDLWLEAIPEHIGVVVGLATHDEITNPKAVQEYVHNCRQARIQKRQRLAAGTASSEKKVTRSISTGSEGSAATTTSTQSTDASPTQLEMLLSTADSFSNLDALDASADSEEMSSGPVAMIECLVWDNYSHGQILAPSPEHTTFIATVRSNEKLGTATVLA